MTETDRTHLLIKEGEGLAIEYKECFTPRIAENMVAFANTRGGVLIPATLEKYR
jgi:predicted HTH transcriptional regulator